MKKNWYAPPAEGEVSYEDLVKKSGSGEFREWAYSCSPFSLRETGYEEVMDDLNHFSPEEFMSAKPEKQEELIDWVLGIYREVDVFPISYLSERGIEEDILKAWSYKAEFRNNGVKAGAGIGSPTCNFLFPNLYHAYSNSDSGKGVTRSTWGKFFDDEFLRRAIRFAWQYSNTTPTPSSIMGALRMTGSSPTNFRPMNAQAIYERLAPNGGVLYDSSTGFGGRLMGALTSKKGYRYVGVDPNTESMFNTHRLADYLEKYLPSTPGVPSVSDRVELHCVGSEIFCGPEESIDAAFTSPPYFDLEIYSDEESQSVSKFPKLDGWLEGFVRPTIRNTVKMLKPGALYAVNIADFRSASGSVNYVDEWSSICEEEGAPRYDTFYLEVNARAGSKQQQMGESKKEPILIFRKER